MEILLGMLLFAFVCANIAPKKGKDKAPWFIFGLLTGPIALIVLLLMPEDNMGMGQVKCPYCAEFVKREAIVCKHCRRDLVQRHDDEDTMPCTRCGHENPVSATDCEACKYKFVV